MPVFNVQIETKGLLLLFQIGITLQPVALHKNVYASVVEDMLLKVGACGQQRGCRGLKHHGASQAGHNWPRRRGSPPTPVLFPSARGLYAGLGS